jgi:hypothetical protein
LASDEQCAEKVRLASSQNRTCRDSGGLHRLWADNTDGVMRNGVIENFWLNALFSVTPTALMGVLFWFIIRSILTADRRERSIYKKMEQEERAKRGLALED